MQEKIKVEIQKTISILKQGGIIVYPTDTIWGLGCDALNEKAIDKLFTLKNRAEEKSMLILIPEENLLMKYVKEVPEQAWDLIQYSERPLTLIYPQAINLPLNLIAKDGTIAIRVVKHGFAHDLLKKFNHPIVSTSANLSNQKSPANFKEIDPFILGTVDYVVDLPLAKTANPQPSVIMKIETNGKFTFIRR